MRSSVFAGLLFLGALPCLAGQRAEELVREALHREIYSLSSERSTLLDEALKLEPESRSALWHSGKVRFNGKWLDAEDVPQQLASARVLDRYQSLRASTPDTAAGHWNLASWCNQQRLRPQARAHLSRVIALEPGHVAARRLLGFIPIGRQWVLQSDLFEAFEEAERERKQLAKHAPTVRGMAAQLFSRSAKARDRAEQVLREATAEWIPALEAFLGTASEQAASRLVQTVGKMPVQRATDSLLRLGLSSQWADIRHEAAQQLGQRRRDQYVPQLLAALEMPATARFQIAGLANGRLVSRMVVQRESMDERQVNVSDTVFRRINLGGSAQAARTQAAGEIRNDNALSARQMAATNMRIALTNQQVMSLLSATTGEQPGPSAQDWWNWWNDENEVFVARKAVRTSYLADEELIIDEIRTVDGNGTGQFGTTVQLPSRSSDCLVAGTPVWTARGPQPIESIRVGDLVLSQSPETGELTYKPVLETTVRPSGPLVRVSVSGNTVSCSGGHPFWVSGEGWVKARNLQSGAPVHTSRGSLAVKEVVTPQEEAVTYNLVVADFHSYFVGENNRLLCHDNTVSERTDAIVPGLAQPQ